MKLIVNRTTDAWWMAQSCEQGSLLISANTTRQNLTAGWGQLSLFTCAITLISRDTWGKKAGFDYIWNRWFILRDTTINRHSLLPWLNACTLLSCVKFVLKLPLQVNEENRQDNLCYSVQCLSVISFSLFSVTKWSNLKYWELDFVFNSLNLKHTHKLDLIFKCLLKWLGV